MDDNHKQLAWYSGPIHKRKVVLRPVRESWVCPDPGCGGEMIYTGGMWPTGDPGYHHQCDKCGLARAIHKEHYPQIVYFSTWDPDNPDKVLVEP